MKENVAPIRICSLLFSFCLVATTCLGLSGCFSGDGPELARVAGIVTLDGKPLENASVSFHPEFGRGSFGRTDQDGHYELRFSGNRKGASLGKHKVTITSQVWAETSRKPGPGQTARSLTEAAAGQARDELLPERYRIREKTVLSADVNAGRNECNFELESE